MLPVIASKSIILNHLAPSLFKFKNFYEFIVSYTTLFNIFFIASYCANGPSFSGIFFHKMPKKMTMMRIRKLSFNCVLNSNNCFGSMSWHTLQSWHQTRCKMSLSSFESKSHPRNTVCLWSWLTPENAVVPVNWGRSVKIDDVNEWLVGCINRPKLHYLNIDRRHPYQTNVRKLYAWDKKNW